MSEADCQTCELLRNERELLKVLIQEVCKKIFGFFSPLILHLQKDEMIAKLTGELLNLKV